MDLTKMCDRCYEVLHDEEVYGISLGFGDNVKVFIGHKYCLSEISIDLERIYGERLNNANKEESD